jgi:phosphoserine phosphatase
VTPRFHSLILDVDSTLSGIEGIDWLARRRDRAVAEAIETLTTRAMEGEIPLEAIYEERLKIIRPRVAEIEALSEAYIAARAPGVEEALAALRAAGVRMVVVSGGIRQAILPLTRFLGFPDDDVDAVSLRFAQDACVGIEPSPMTTQAGKPEARVVQGLAAPVLAVGDGMTDLVLRQPPARAFAAYTGFARRGPVVDGADYVIESFDALRALVLDGQAINRS